MMMGLIIKILVELLSVLALATKQIKQGRLSECAVRYTLFVLNMYREIREEFAGERERQDTGCP